MSEYAQQLPLENTGGEASKIETPQRLGRVTVLEALAEETTAVSPDMSHRSTMQGKVDFEDD
ncbi:MAG: hypothetical protein ABI602_01645 [Candidatus Saccharibacteria bacterium]